MITVWVSRPVKDVNKWAKKKGWLLIYADEREDGAGQCVFLTPDAKKVVINHKGDKVIDFLVMAK